MVGPQEWNEEEIEFRAADDRIQGTLITPASERPHPALVFVHGSGQQDRDGELAVYRVQAQEFARRGIAALLYDKRDRRGLGQDRDATFTELADDVLAAVQYLRARPDTANPEQIGLWALSQGCWVAPLVAVGPGNIAFLILVSPAGVSSAQQNLEMWERRLQTAGRSEEEIVIALGYMVLHNNVIRTGEGLDECCAYFFHHVNDQEWTAYVDPVPMPLMPSVPFNFNPAVARELDRDPLPILAAVQCPVLALYGGLDTVISPVTDRRRVQAALLAGENPATQVQVFEGAGHDIVMEAAFENRADPRTPLQVNAFAPGYYDLMVSWALQHTHADSS